MAGKAEQLHRVGWWRAAYQTGNTASLGEVLSELMEGRVAPKHSRFGLISEALSQVLPSELYQHCRIVDVSGGRIKVAANSPSYVYELQLLSYELLKELARRFPQARIKEIKFTVG